MRRMVTYEDNSAFIDDELRDEWVDCPTCRSVMHPLATYELPNISEFPAAEVDFWQLLLWGWMVIVANFLVGLITYGSRKALLARQKQTILPRFPNSLVCPRCLSVMKRM